MKILVEKEIPCFVSTNFKEYGGFKAGDTIKEGEIPQREFELIQKLKLGRLIK